MIIFITILFSNIAYGILPFETEYNVLCLSKLNKYDSSELFINYEQLERNSHSEYITSITSLTNEEALFLFDQCSEKDIDIFLILGLMRVESNFDTNAVGRSGERGLGQLKDKTAKSIANNLGIDYNVKYLFNPKYNINLFTTHLSYLYKKYDDLHKALTAYNRGEYGLKKFMVSREGSDNPARSRYSDKVIKYRNKYYMEYQKNVVQCNKLGK